VLDLLSVFEYMFGHREEHNLLDVLFLHYRLAFFGPECASRNNYITSGTHLVSGSRETWGEVPQLLFESFGLRSATRMESRN
jgi:hypothetical protein